MPRTANGYDLRALRLFSPRAARGAPTKVSDVEVLQSPFSAQPTRQPLRPSSVWLAVSSLVVIVFFLAECFHLITKRGFPPRIRRRLASWGHGGGEGLNEQQYYKLPGECGEVMTSNPMQGPSTSAQQQQSFVLGQSAPPHGHLPEDVSQPRKRKAKTRWAEIPAGQENGAQPMESKRFFQGPTQQHPMQPSVPYREAMGGDQMSFLELLNWSPSEQAAQMPFNAQVQTPQAPQSWAVMSAGVAPDGRSCACAPPVALPPQQSFDQSQILQGGSYPPFQAAPSPFLLHQSYEGPQTNVYWAPLGSAEQGVDRSVQQQGMMLHPSSPGPAVTTQVSAASSSLFDESELRHSASATGQTAAVDPEVQRLIDIYMGDDLAPPDVSTIQVSLTSEKTSRTTVPQFSTEPLFSPAAAAPTAFSSSFNVADPQGWSGVPYPYSAAFPQQQHPRFAEASAVDPSALTVGGEDPRQSYQGAVLGTEQVAGGPSASMEDSNPHQAATDFVQQGPTGFYPLGKAVQKERWHVRDLPFKLSDDPTYSTNVLYRLPRRYEGEQLVRFSCVGSYGRLAQLIYAVHEFFMKPSFSKEDAQELVFQAAELVAYSRDHLKGDIDGTNMRNAVEGLARRFLALDALWSISEVVGEAAGKHEWWESTVETSIGRLEAWDVKFKVNHKESASKDRPLIPILVLALRAFKAGDRPAPQFVVEIKERLFGGQAPSTFRKAEWDKMRSFVKDSGLRLMKAQRPPHPLKRHVSKQ